MKKIIIAFAAGQIVQLIIHAVALNLWNSRQIPFCMAGGFLVLFALICGAWAANMDKPKEKKTYLDWAKVPGEDE